MRTGPKRGAFIRIGRIGRMWLLALAGEAGFLALTHAPAQAAPFAYITNRESDTVSVVDAATNTVVATVWVRSGFLPALTQGVAVHPAGTRVYVTNFAPDDSAVPVIDTTTNELIAAIRMGTGAEPCSVAVHPSGSRVYVTNYGNRTLAVLDTATDSLITMVGVGGHPCGVAVHPAGTRVYVANAGDGTVSVIDTATNAVVATIPGALVPHGVAVHPNGSRLYVTNFFSNTILVVDTNTNTVIATVQVGSSPGGVATHPSGARVYVANYSSGTLSVIATATNTVIATVQVGSSPNGVAVHPDGTRVYVANSGENTISVIDTASNVVVATVRVGRNPQAFGQFIGPLLQGVSLALNEGAFRTGQVLTLAAATYAGDKPRPVDAYVAIQLPDETLLFLQPDGRLTSDVRPLVSNWTVAPFGGEIFRYTFTGEEPRGGYRWLAAFTDPGTLNIIGGIAQASFRFDP